MRSQSGLYVHKSLGRSSKSLLESHVPSPRCTMHIYDRRAVFITDYTLLRRAGVNPAFRGPTTGLLEALYQRTPAQVFLRGPTKCFFFGIWGTI